MPCSKRRISGRMTSAEVRQIPPVVSGECRVREERMREECITHEQPDPGSDLPIRDLPIHVSNAKHPHVERAPVTRVQPGTIPLPYNSGRSGRQGEKKT